MKFERVYFVNGTAYAGKSTLVKALARKYDGIACEENYHDALLPELDKNEFPNLTYTRDLEDWHLFIRRTPEVYARWVRDVAKECEILELRMLEEIVKEGKPVFVDTNISVETLKDISDESHVLIMLSDPSISVNRFFERPDKEKQFLYQLMLEEEDPQAALDNFRQGLTLINSPENYEALLHSGFPVLLRDENHTPEQTLALAEEIFGLRK